jgi:hypothetical protein
MRRRQFARGVISRVGLMAAAVIVLATATQRAEALSLAGTLAVPVTKAAVTDGLTTEVRYGGGHGGGFHGGGFRGGGFRGGGFRGGGAAFHRGGFRAGGFRYGGFRRHYGGGYRYAYHRRHFHRRFYYGSSYYHHRYCRIVLTHYGPRRICRPWWYRHHYW